MAVFVTMVIKSYFGKVRCYCVDNYWYRKI